MKHELEWRQIAIHGLSIYEINNIGEVRFKYGRKRIQMKVIKGGKRFYILKHRGKEKEYLVSELLDPTFGAKRIREENDKTFIEPPVPKSAQFSKNEDDYGGRGGGEWEEIRSLAKMATKIRKRGGV